MLLSYFTNSISIWVSVYLKLVSCHLKDLGEVSVNWTVVLTNLEKRIVGGVPTTINQYPFNVQFLNYGGLCSGSILTGKIVLTAAHCFDHNKNIAEMRILSSTASWEFTERFFSSTRRVLMKYISFHRELVNIAEYGHRTFAIIKRHGRYLFDPEAKPHEVWEFVLHEYYNEPIMFSNDIAIIMIHGTFLFGGRVQRGVIGNSDVWMRENETFVATGWGNIQYNGKLSEQGLMRTHLRYILKNKCMEENRVMLSPDMFCLFGDGARDTCSGDSGGAVLWNDMIVGIVSHGKGCAEAPSMYVNVYYFKPWITKTVERLYGQFCHFHRFAYH